MVQHGQAGDLLLAALRDPTRAAALPETDWDLLLRLARRAGLLAHLGYRVEAAGRLDAVPEKARVILLAARVVPTDQERMVRWEVDRIGKVLGPLGIRPVLLKGAAYVIEGLPNARGRIVTDVDLLVPKAELAAVEGSLLASGWEAMKLADYDQRYYREWMHELPPLRHRTRQTVVDVHHTLLPPTGRFTVDPDRLLARARPSSSAPGYRVLDPADMVLHSTVHLFLEGDPVEGLRLRDLVDIDGLLRHFGREPTFWDSLVPRARELGLQRPLFYSLRYAERLLGTPVPQGVQGAATTGQPAAPVRLLMDLLVPRAILPEHPDHPLRRAAVSRWLLYLRSHWLRMPPVLLLRHLTYKAWLGMTGNREQREEAAPGGG